MKKTGFVALIGHPNVGKSTMLNQLLGQKISIVSDKPQTTRHRILGISTDQDSQIIFVDTPGIHQPGSRLNDRMMDTVYDALRSVDLVVQVVDVSKKQGKGEEYVVDLVKANSKPTFLVLNKIDLVNKGKILPLMEFYSQQFSYGEIIPISAIEKDNLILLREKIVENLPEGHFFYPSEHITDQTERFIVSEIIREKILHHTRQELPYTTAVLVEHFDEGDRENGFVHVAASIIVEKESQKKIIIGRAGKMIKMIGTEARLDMERFLQVRKIYLELNVKAVLGWRDREHVLDELGVRLGDYIKS
jgi:GTP-binding protein Era